MRFDWRAVCLVVLCATVALAGDHAPLPIQLTAAKTVRLINESGDLRAFDHFWSDVKKWNRFKIPDDAAAEVDVVMVLTSTKDAGTMTGFGGAVGGVSMFNAFSVPSEHLYLRVLDFKTGAVLWTDDAEKWIVGAGHAPGKLVSHLRKRLDQK